MFRGARQEGGEGLLQERGRGCKIHHLKLSKNSYIHPILVQDPLRHSCGYQPGEKELPLDGPSRSTTVLHLEIFISLNKYFFSVFDGDQFCGGVVIDNRSCIILIESL